MAHCHLQISHSFNQAGGGPEVASGHDPEGCRRIDPSVDQSVDLADDPYGARTDMAFGSDPPFDIHGPDCPVDSDGAMIHDFLFQAFLSPEVESGYP